MNGELSCESAMTINKLSNIFSVFFVDEQIEDVVFNNFNRAMIYPLIRNFEFAQ